MMIERCDFDGKRREPAHYVHYLGNNILHVKTGNIHFKIDLVNGTYEKSTEGKTPKTHGIKGLLNSEEVLERIEQERYELSERLRRIRNNLEKKKEDTEHTEEILQVILELNKDEKSIPIAKVMEVTEARGLIDKDVKKSIDILKREGRIYSPQINHLKLL